MPTNDRKVNIYPRKLLGRTAIKEQFLDYLQGCLDELGTSFFAGQSGTLDQDKVLLNHDSGGNTFDIDTTDANRVLAGNHVIDLDAITGTGITTAIPFENATGIVYYAGVHFAEVEDGVEVNPRTGDPEYQAWKQTFGNVANPTSVTDHGTYIRIDLTSITEAGVDHSGRDVRVWLVDPVSPVEAVAFFDGTISYGGGINYVDIPYSGANGPLGQDTSAAPPSTTAADYKVFIEGITWRRNTDLRLDTSYAFLGTITGNPTTPVFDETDQVLLQIVSLDRAYDGIPGPGTGRQITVDAGAVNLLTPVASYPSSGDHFNTQLVMDRRGSNDYAHAHLTIIPGDLSTVPMQVLGAAVAGGFNWYESGTKSGSSNVITFSGMDLTQAHGDDLKKHHLLYVATGVEADRGIYVIDSYTALTMTLRRPDGVTPSFTAESVTCWLFNPMFHIGGAAAYWSSADWLDGFFLKMVDPNNNTLDFNILTEEGAINLYDAGGGNAYARRLLMSIDGSKIGSAHQYPFTFRRGMVVRGGNVSGGGGEESWYWRDGVRIYDAGGGVEDRDPMFALAVDYGWPEDVPTYHTWPCFAVDTLGGVARGHHFRDDCFYEPNKWTGPSNGPAHYNIMGAGGYTVRARDASNGASYGHGCIEVASGAGIGDYAWINSPHACNLNRDYDFRWTFRGRLKMLDAVSDNGIIFGLRSGGMGGNRRFYFWHDPVTPYHWHFHYWNGSTGVNVDTGVGSTLDKYQWFEIFIGGSIVVWTIEEKDHVAASYAQGSVSIGTLNQGTTDVCAMVCMVDGASTGAVRRAVIDYWEVFDIEVLYGRLGNSHNLNHP